MVGDMKPFTERQKQLAKPFRPWSKTLINLLNNMKIQPYPISTMVGGALTLVKDTKILAEKQRPWSKT